MAIYLVKLKCAHWVNIMLGQFAQQAHLTELISKPTPGQLIWSCTLHRSGPNTGQGGLRFQMGPKPKKHVFGHQTPLFQPLPFSVAFLIHWDLLIQLKTHYFQLAYPATIPFTNTS